MTIRAAVITGGHEYDVPAFHTLFRSFCGIDAYIQHLDDFVADAGRVRRWYDVIVFYHLDSETPTGQTREALEGLGATGQGILVLHHALVAYPDWQPWSDICGIAQRSVSQPGFGSDVGQRLRLEIADAGHPITRGLSAWELIDETYTMPNADPSSEILLTTTHPRSMRTIAWTRQYGSSRVLCFQSGHDAQAYGDPGFRKVMAQGIRWLAGREEVER